MNPTIDNRVATIIHKTDILGPNLFPQYPLVPIKAPSNGNKIISIYMRDDKRIK